MSEALAANGAATVSSAAPSNAVNAFVRELSGRDKDRLPAVQFLLKHGACARCCLRFSGKMGPCKVPEVSRPSLLDAMAAVLRDGTAAVSVMPAEASAAAAPVAPAAASSRSDQPASSNGAAGPSMGVAAQTEAASAALTPGAALPPDAAAAVSGSTAAGSGTGAVANGDTAVSGDAADAAAAEPSLEAPDPVCPLCLGMLQSLDANARLQPGGQAIALPETDAGGGTWLLADSGTAETLAQLIRWGLSMSLQDSGTGCTTC